MKKIVHFVLVVILILVNTLIPYGKEETTPNYIDASQKNMGIIKVGYLKPTDKRIRLLVEKGEEVYSYNLHGNRMENFPLQMGNGEYVIRILENIEGNLYQEVVRETMKVEIGEGYGVFLSSIQEIKWDNESRAIIKAKELITGLESDEEKVYKIYDYIVNNISYDFDKVNQLNYSYLPNIDETLMTGKGICYDYASLFAAMLRGIGIPTKMVKGNAQGVKEYHAWNEVYIKELDKWVIIDTSYDAQIKDKDSELRIYKSPEKYQMYKVY